MSRSSAECWEVAAGGLKGLPEAIGTVWPQAVVQTCVVHLPRASFRYAARQHWRRHRQRAAPGLHRAHRIRRARALHGVRRA
ncbi:transposase [Nonomuraea sp. NPDC050383]|uniref:transposase n=1 Tax=Nonomuraea sp. NPDC050383 TaxID=3364362 RepID=UPI0037A4B92B